VTNLVRTLELFKAQDFEIVGLDAEGTAQLCDLPFAPAGRVLVVGSEGHGLRRLVRETCDTLAKIELFGPIASLNASVAAAIALYESARARKAALHAGK
jgi:23S rRNA (guanosine2251-2'-O)-methyltransferase